MTASQLTIGYGALRIAYAAALLAAPARTVRPWLGDVAQHDGATVAVRGLGARDLALSTGAVACAASGRSPRAWLAACAASDVADLAATLAADGSRLPSRAKLGTVAAAGTFAAIGAALAAR